MGWRLALPSPRFDSLGGEVDTVAKESWEEIHARMEHAPDGYVPECDYPGWKAARAMPLFPTDWLGDDRVRSMRMEHRAAYLQVLLIEHQAGSCPLPIAQLSRSCALDPRQLRSTMLRVATCFMRVSDDRFVSKRAEKERRYRRKKCRVRVSPPTPTPNPLEDESSKSKSAREEAETVEPPIDPCSPQSPEVSAIRKLANVVRRTAEQYHRDQGHTLDDLKGPWAVWAKGRELGEVRRALGNFKHPSEAPDTEKRSGRQASRGYNDPNKFSDPKFNRSVIRGKRKV